mmetsp:Transcript_21475/g.32852  ORF Transcript_21475/g.32852 Transcript_21475/m.32852 type:complete len:144 (+) Transcript_21475:264-695(+)
MRRIFTALPGVQVLFSFGHKYDLGAEEMYSDPGFLRHASNVTNLLDKSVNMLINNSTAPLLAILKAMGSRHVGYGLKSEHYPVIGESLIETLRGIVADQFTEEVEVAWVMIFGVISSAMLEGAKEAEAADDSSEESCNLKEIA